MMMRFCSFAGVRALAVGSLLLINSTAYAAKDDDGEYVMRWSSTGGGWRAMVACMGYANAFQQAGLFRDGESKFSAIAVNSGAAWFATQFFYSDAFYQQTMDATPEELYDFVVLWMDSYLNLLNRVTNSSSSSTAASLDDITNTSALEGGDDTTTEEEEDQDDEASSTNVYLQEFFDLFDAFDGDWAYFVQQMLDAAANDYDHNSGGIKFVDIPATGRNRIGSMNTTELLIQTALAPTARYRSKPPPTINETETELEEDDSESSGGGGGLLGGLIGGGEQQPDDLLLYLGPVDNTNQVYSVALSAAYIVNDTFHSFQYSTFDSGDSGNVAVYQGTTSPSFDFNDWDAFFLYDDSMESNPSVFIDDLDVVTQTTNQTLMKKPFSSPRGGFPGGRPPEGGGPGGPPPPFSGAATVTQVAAISSAAVGTGSPAIPSVFAQTYSRSLSNINGLTQQVAFGVAVGSLYDAPSLDDIAVCGQWPNQCNGARDGWFIDGGFADNPSFAINIAQYHQSANADITKPMKIVLTQTNQVLNATYTLAQTTQYFETDFNQGVPPGEYVWVPETHIPRRSPQVFGESLDETTLLEMQQPFGEGSNMTWCILEGTTIDNPAFGIRAGQQVEILLLHLNTAITTFIAGQTAIEENTIPLAEMAKHIASNQELIQVVQDFFYPNGIPTEEEEGMDAVVVDEEQEATNTTPTGGDDGTGEEDTTNSSKTNEESDGEGEATENGGGDEAAGEPSQPETFSGSSYYLQNNNNLVALTALSLLFSLIITN